MTVTYTRTYTGSMVKDVRDLKDVVQSFQCLITGTDGTTTASINMRVDLTDPDPETFIVFEDLTKELLDEWTDEHLDVAGIEEDIANKIIAINNSRSITDKAFPF
jgi:hypothetical protein